MQLTLKNFKCYTDKSFELGSDGLTLLSGISGTGKSTILQAIQFAYTGIGNKIITHGKTSCEVTLKFGDLTIVRTKKPNRVVVNDVYEDNAAQDIINKQVGDTFDEYKKSLSLIYKLKESATSSARARVRNSRNFPIVTGKHYLHIHRLLLLCLVSLF